MGRCRDDGWVPCGCHPETCTHFGRRVYVEPKEKEKENDNMSDLNKINGNEIIDFLNGLDDIDGASITPKSFEFVSQSLANGKYTLEFAATHNNWGTEQDIYNNMLVITDNDIYFDLNEPFEGDETADILGERFTDWFKGFDFNSFIVEDFNKLIENAYYDLNHVSYNDGEKLDKVIKMLTKAKTYIK